ncbi:DUF732 domain-containing protein [Mycobacterium asiaticum]|uniref:DUF732 domain-containing protein n=1 Tax=Mycobacterium asiaticum TaxID=1790 RepID=A0A1A3KQK1_MYCAS|nr:DUF732 domain-containing protein [Mycobacterium asiaticum]OBJ86653.1 hypothetical protein A5640_09875 [Mycobacterium asiaticum]ORA16151.1 hypothetical protein BST16_07515 [Mycobacterium asiaticum DSM 44297]
MSGFAIRVTPAIVTLAIAVSPAAHAEPGPGSGETFFVDYMTRVFTPPTSEAAAREVIPLAEQVCAARSQGQTDLQAAGLVLAGNGVAALGLASGSSIEDERTALNVVNAATLAYCPQYNTSINAPVAPGEVD